MNRSRVSLSTHAAFDGSNTGFAIARRTEKVDGEAGRHTYSFTSHERSCEQNGQGNDRVKASIRFCFGGGLRFDLRFPIAGLIDEREEKRMTTIIVRK